MCCPSPWFSPFPCQRSDWTEEAVSCRCATFQTPKLLFWLCELLKNCSVFHVCVLSVLKYWMQKRRVLNITYCTVFGWVNVDVCVFVYIIYSIPTSFMHLHMVSLLICRRIMNTFMQGVSHFSSAVSGLHLPARSVTNHMSCKMEHTSFLLQILRTSSCPCVIINLM